MQKRTKAASWLAAVAVVSLPAAAQAHVSLHPNTLPAGSIPTLSVRVPNEEDTASTVKVDMQVPPGFTEVPTGYLPGWKVQVNKRKLAQPLKTDQGTVTEEVSEIIWSGGKIPPGQFLDFPILVTVPDGAAGKTLTFKTVQTYSNGTVVSWIGPPSADKPAPTVNVTAKGGVIEDVPGTEAGPGTAPASSTKAAVVVSKPASSSDSASKGLGVAALILGILGLLVGLVALVVARRRKPGAAVG